MNNNKPKIPKGWRQIRLGEILPENHKFYSTYFKKWFDDGGENTLKCAGSRLERGGLICITQKIK